MSSQYKTLHQIDMTREELKAWADCRETSIEVALAIHAIADASRNAEAIWSDPTRNEWDQVLMAVENYVASGEFEADEVYHWGEESFSLGNV